MCSCFYLDFGGRKFHQEKRNIFSIRLVYFPLLSLSSSPSSSSSSKTTILITQSRPTIVLILYIKSSPCLLLYPGLVPFFCKCMTLSGFNLLFTLRHVRLFVNYNDQQFEHCFDRNQGLLV